MSRTVIAGREIIGNRVLASGHNTTLFLLEDVQGHKLVAKQAENPEGAANLDIEGWMLRYLKHHTQLPVPEVFESSPSLLVMDYLPNRGGMGEGAEEEAAWHMAALHSIRGHHFGLERDTLIGPLHQPNTPSEKWLPFFAEQRLLHMAKAAFDERKIDPALLGKIENVAQRLGEWLDEPDYPALIHGDLWQGNVLVNDGAISGFIDPAIYYADPEIELAFATLFGTFSEPFFRRYQELRPISDDFFDIRRDLYNLYPLLVHVRLYGGAYASSVKQIASRFVG